MAKIEASRYYRDPVVWAILHRILDNKSPQPIDAVAIAELKKLAANTTGAARERLEALAAHKEFPIAVRYFAEHSYGAKRPKTDVEVRILATANADVEGMLTGKPAQRSRQRSKVPADQNFSGELLADEEFVEGAVSQILVNRYERNLKAKKACLNEHGHSCKVCKFNFRERYGEIGDGFIHVHHRKPLALRKAEYHLNPSKDLVPVCPNCHAMLHSSDPPLTVNELRDIWRKHNGN
jgi:hypothetical protein